jgi:hypothetical protein
MVNLKNRYNRETKTFINRKIRLEICAVHSVEWHKEPNDHKFNTVTVVMRDRRKKTDTSKSYYRAKLPVLQNFIGGHHGGSNWNPRKGDLVYVLFYKEREGIVIGNAWSWAEYPICRPTPYDIAFKGGQWPEPYQDGCGDFPKQPYPALKKPFCFRWWHGPITGSTGKGRDWAWMLDYCRLGDDKPSCKDCKDIDSICRSLNHFFKFYSSETESKKAHPDRGEYHAPCGSYWMFDSKCCADCENCTEEECCSEVFTKGKGYWRIQGATSEQSFKGHITHDPTGSVDIHSATSDPADNTGVRCKVVAPDDNTEDFAFEAKDFSTGAYIRILKNGEIKLYSPVKITLDAPLVQETNNNQVGGTCSHGSCSCDGCGGSSTGTGSQQAIEHGLTDEEGNKVVPGEVSVCCTSSGGSCSCSYCDDTYIYVICTNGVTFIWKVRR